MIYSVYDIRNDEDEVFINDESIGFVTIGLGNKINRAIRVFEDKLKYARRCYQRRLCLDMSVTKEDYRRLLDNYDKKMASYEESM